MLNHKARVRSKSLLPIILCCFSAKILDHHQPLYIIGLLISFEFSNPYIVEAEPKVDELYDELYEEWTKKALPNDEKSESDESEETDKNEPSEQMETEKDESAEVFEKIDEKMAEAAESENDSESENSDELEDWLDTVI